MATVTPKEIYLEDHEERRFYSLTCQPTLFGWPSVFASWGSLDSNRGSSQLHIFDDEADAMTFFEKKKREKERRGYRAFGGIAVSA